MTLQEKIDFYQISNRISTLYTRLQDDLSREIFWTRVKLDLFPSADTLIHLICLSGLLTPEQMEVQQNWRTSIHSIISQRCQLFLYGAGKRGAQIGKCLLNDGVDFSGFCDREYHRFRNGFCGKTVFSPQYLIEHHTSCYVIITSAAYRNEIVCFLKENGFPEGHILPYFSDYVTGSEGSGTNQYFEFPQLFSKGTSFVDGGCFDGQDSIRFAKWCDGTYDKIFAFEPDSANYKKCRVNLAETPRVKMIHAGLGECSTVADFFSLGQVHSRFVNSKKESRVVDELSQTESIQLTALDDLTDSEKIGFVKMDIEGSEWSALHGAEKTIMRDKPLLAICVYHVPGDTLAIMDYLSQLVPEYRFWLRHYATSSSETVLYAAVTDTL